MPAQFPGSQDDAAGEVDARPVVFIPGLVAQRLRLCRRHASLEPAFPFLFPFPSSDSSAPPFSFAFFFAYFDL